MMTLANMKLFIVKISRRSVNNMCYDSKIPTKVLVAMTRAMKSASNSPSIDRVAPSWQYSYVR